MILNESLTTAAASATQHQDKYQRKCVSVSNHVQFYLIFQQGANHNIKSHTLSTQFDNQQIFFDLINK